MILKLIIILIVCIIAGFVLLIARAKFIERSRSVKATAKLESAIKKLDVDPDTAKCELRKLGGNAELRNALYEMLKSLGKQDYFPKEFLNQEAFAESDMVFWLCHPNELKKAPDEIELTTKIKKRLSDEANEVEFFVFRFRVNEPHWAAKYGWMAGITGPYMPGGDVVTFSIGTFSELEPYASKTPEDHVDYFVSKQSSIIITKTRAKI